MSYMINNFVVINGFMVDGLDLSGNELVVYAIIYGFCQDQQSHPIRISFMQQWVPLTRQGMIKLIHGLKKKKLIEVQKKGRINWYKISQEPIDEYAKKVAVENEEREKNRKKGASPWDKALEKARAEINTKNQPEKLKKVGEQLKGFDPFSCDW